MIFFKILILSESWPKYDFFIAITKKRPFGGNIDIKRVIAKYNFFVVNTKKAFLIEMLILSVLWQKKQCVHSNLKKYSFMSKKKIFSVISKYLRLFWYVDFKRVMAIKRFCHSDLKKHPFMAKNRFFKWSQNKALFF